MRNERFKFLLKKNYDLKPVFLDSNGPLHLNEIIHTYDFDCKLDGKLVLCALENSKFSLAGYLQFMMSGAIPIIVGEQLCEKKLVNIINTYAPHYIWINNKNLNKFTKIGAKKIFSISGFSLFDISKYDFEINSELMLLLSTSGSTGSPKYVRLSVENVLSNAISIAEYLKLNDNDLPITTLPPSYTYGLSIIHSHLIAGSTIAVTDKTFFNREFWDLFRRLRATSFGGVPYHYEMLKKLRFTKMNLPSLNKLTQAGGRMEPELTREFAEFAKLHGIEYYTMYGQAEATARMSYLPPERAITKSGSIGVAIPGGRFWLEDENGEVIRGDDIVGELVYSGQNVSMGYASSYKDLAKGDERNGILRTGDLAKKDVDGDYYIVGRLKRFIKLFGHRTNLLDIENIILTQGVVAACSGKDDVLEIYALGIDEHKGIKIKQLVSSHLRVALQGIVVYSITDFPRNDSGKIHYANLIPDLGVKVA